ncbi:SusC/RagA family TonB-linked outer membrane protein [Niabella sp.]|uniref:SusC/RagA family TonB-linked outer membrane protein n=1 Tax=Niabella sp. TaxID=1962976 RepID=UPI00260C4F54|nr:SusC/RagA family TonB-linked outer membrane protein [Niabella sp.]
MKAKQFLAFCLSLLCTFAVQAQDKAVHGRVTGADGSPLSGVTISIKKSNRAVLTDADGKYNFKAAVGETLVFSYVGYLTQEVAVKNSDELNVTLQSSATELTSVVVTALGIKRNKASLTYASQTVGGDELRKASNTNFVDALSGKAAGLDIKVSGSGAGGSTKAVLRGNKSLLGTSEALYVIDGIPLVNNKTAQPGSYGGTDGGDGLSSINPSDIESINVLRGANAAILYGSQGANGVILITTKKGRTGKMSVDFNSSTVFEQVSGLPKFQYRYGTTGGDYSWVYPKVDPTGVDGIKPTDLINMQKSPVVNITSDNYQKNYIKDFFRTGVTATNSVSIAGGNDKTTVYFSYANISATGVMPTNTYSKNNFAFNQSTKLFNDKLTISSNIILSGEISKNRPGAGYYNNPLTGLYLFARDRNFDTYKNNYQVFDSTRNMYKMNWYSTEEKQNNPYWEIYKDPKLATSKRAIANLKLAYDIAEGLRFEVRGNIDYNNVVRDYRYAANGNTVSVSANGKWDYTKYTDQSLYTDGILTYNKTFGAISLNTLAGLSYQKNIFNDGMNVNNGTVALQYPNFFTLANIPYNVIINSTGSTTIKEGAFANATIGYKEMAFLDLAARNDWASTLALTGNDSYLYPSIGGSIIVNKMVQLPKAISFLKLRASFSQTANEVPFNVVNPWNTIGGAGGPDGIGGINRNTQVPFTNLKPEKIVSNEYGIETRFFDGRLGFDFTYYKDISTNQFLTLAAPSGSGFTTYYVNAGKIDNHGFEFTLSADPVRTQKFSWRTAFNGSRNTNKIVELIATNPNYQVGGDDEGFASIIKAGGSFNDVYIYKFARNASGQIILSDKAVPTKAPTQEKVGNANPDFLLGWSNNFSYNNFFASFLVNGKFGGVAFSKTEAFLDSYGVSERTAAARDQGAVPINAILGTTAVTSIDPATYYSAVGDRNKIMEPYIFSRTNVRLGQLVFGYNFRSKSANPIFKDASVSLVGRNLFFFYKKAPFDPEQAMSTGNAMQSNDVFSLPSTRSFGFNVKFTF